MVFWKCLCYDKVFEYLFLVVFFVKKLSDMGEREAIRLISGLISSGKEIVGVGDDCAVFELDDEFLLVTTDMINEKTHVPKGMSAWQMGWFLVAVNLSDIAAKGGSPLGILISLGLPRETTKDFLVDFMKGANKCALVYKTSIVGGDTKENQSVTASGTAFGKVGKDFFMGRVGAEVGDVVAVTGSLGRAGAGFFAIERGIDNKMIIEGLLEPRPRVPEGIKLGETGVVSCCMDVSDGLSSSLYQLSESNSVGFKIDKRLLPVSPFLRDLSEDFDLDVYKNVLHFGGDYELLLTLSDDDFNAAKEAVKSVGGVLTKIGCVTEENIVLVDSYGEKTLENKGYEHFK